MKKYNVFKVLLIAIIATIIVSYLIPQSTISYYSTGVEEGTIAPITLVDSVSNGLTSLSVFISAFVYILCIGVFYAVIRKTGKYDDIINNTACKFKNKKGAFIVISILTLGILTAIIGDMFPMLVLVPAFMDIAKKLGYDSKKAIMATIGAILLGSTGSLYTYYANQIMGVTVTSNIIVKIIMIVISLGSLILFTLLGKKPENVKLEEKKVSKGLPITILFDIILLLIIVGMVPWESYFGFEGFSNFYTTLEEFEVFDVSLFGAIIGTTFAAFGEWSIYNITVTLVIFSVIIACIYKIKVEGLLESIANGIRKALPYALILVVANIVLVGVYNSGLFITVIAKVSEMSDYVLSSTTLSALSSVVYPDYTYGVEFTLSTLLYTLESSSAYALIAVAYQAIYSLCLLVSPTSVLLLMALHHESINYKDWIKYIYKYFLSLLIVFFIVLMIVGREYISLASFVVLVILIMILVLLSILNKDNTSKVENKTAKKNVKEEKEETTKKSETKNNKTTNNKKTASKKTKK